MRIILTARATGRPALARLLVRVDAATMGLVVATRHLGPAPAVRRDGRAAGRRVADERVRGRAVPARGSAARRWAPAWPRRSRRTDDADTLRDLAKAADATGCERVVADRVLHGRHERAASRVARPVRPAGRLLRDDPRAAGLGRARPARAARTARRRSSRTGCSRSSASSTRTPRPTTSPPSRQLGVTTARYPEADPRLRPRPGA